MRKERRKKKEREKRKKREITISFHFIII